MRIRLRFSLRSCGAPSAECCVELFTLLLSQARLLEVGRLRVLDLAVSHRLDHLHSLCTLTTF